VGFFVEEYRPAKSLKVDSITATIRRRRPRTTIPPGLCGSRPPFVQMPE